MYKSDPVLASLDIARTVQFYEEILGFKTSWSDANYCVVKKHKIAIHFWKCDDNIFPENTSCYIYVKNISHLYQLYSIKGIIHPNGQLEDKHWGMREFAILDVDGNMIKFGQPIQKRNFFSIISGRK